MGTVDCLVMQSKVGADRSTSQLIGGVVVAVVVVRMMCPCRIRQQSRATTGEMIMRAAVGLESAEAENKLAIARASGLENRSKGRVVTVRRV